MQAGPPEDRTPRRQEVRFFVLRNLFHEEDGQTLVEYGLMVSLIALVTIAVLTVLGRKIRNLFVSVNSNIKSTT